MEALRRTSRPIIEIVSEFYIYSLFFTFNNSESQYEIKFHDTPIFVLKYLISAGNLFMFLWFALRPHPPQLVLNQK